jgi:hypothetical protein
MAGVNYTAGELSCRPKERLQARYCLTYSSHPTTAPSRPILLNPLIHSLNHHQHLGWRQTISRTRS